MLPKGQASWHMRQPTHFSWFTRTTSAPSASLVRLIAPAGQMRWHQASLHCVHTTGTASSSCR